MDSPQSPSYRSDKSQFRARTLGSPPLIERAIILRKAKKYKEAIDLFDRMTDDHGPLGPRAQAELEECRDGLLALQNNPADGYHRLLHDSFANGEPEDLQDWGQGMCDWFSDNHKTTRSSFTYLLHNPEKMIAPPGQRQLTFEQFIRSVIYIGRGVGTRSSQHVHETIEKIRKGSDFVGDPKCVQLAKLLKDDQGVFVTEFGHNASHEETATTELAMIRLVPMEHITNKDPGNDLVVLKKWWEEDILKLGLYSFWKAYKTHLINPNRRYRYPVGLTRTLTIAEAQKQETVAYKAAQLIKCSTFETAVRRTQRSGHKMVVFAPLLDLDWLEQRIWMFRRDYCKTGDPMSSTAINAFNRHTDPQRILLSTSVDCFQTLQLEEGDAVMTIDTAWDPNNATDNSIPGRHVFMKVDNLSDPKIMLFVWQFVGESNCRSGRWKKYGHKEQATEIKEYFIKLYSNSRGYSNYPVKALYPSIPALSAHWFPSDRILELLQKQFEHYLALMRMSGSLEADDGRLGLSVDEAKELRYEVENLMKPSIGFLEQFLQASAKFGRTALLSISTHTNEPYDYVVRYSQVFWKKIKNLPDADTIYRKVERGESAILTREEQGPMLARKVLSCPNPEDNMVIVYDRTTGRKVHSASEDRRLLCEVQGIGLETVDLWAQVAKTMAELGFPQRNQTVWKTRFHVLMKLVKKEFTKS